MIEIDNILEKCGDFHRYQIILLALFCIINLLSSMHYYSQTIISFVPEHWCFDKTLENATIKEVRNTFVNYEKPSCTQLNYRNSTIHDDYDQNICNKWIYNYDFGYKSMTSELNWVCQSSWKSTLGQSMFFIGSVLGTLGFGIMADITGRLPVLVLSNLMAFIGNILTMFAKTVPFFSLFRFISGLATDSNFVMMYILVMEYIRPSMRTTGLSICIGLFYCLGSILTPWLAVATGNWRMFLLSSAIPLLVVPFFSLIVSESAQWLVTKKKYDKAVQCFKKVAKVNRKNVDNSQFKEFIEVCSKKMENSTSNTASIFDLFKTPRLRKNTLILFFKSMVITLCYDAISRNVEGFGMSPFIMFSLSATAILPACIVVILIQDKIGRKAMASSSLLVSGVFTCATGIIIAYQKSSTEKNTYLLATLSIIGRFGVTVAYNSGVQYATELIPTCVRGQGVAAVHVAGYAATFFSSYILFLSTVFLPFPYLILGTLSLIGAGLCLLLPETLNRTLPCTLEAAEEFGRNERIFYFSCLDRVQNNSQATLHEPN